MLKIRFFIATYNRGKAEEYIYLFTLLGLMEYVELLFPFSDGLAEYLADYEALPEDQATCERIALAKAEHMAAYLRSKGVRIDFVAGDDSVLNVPWLAAQRKIPYFPWLHSARWLEGADRSDRGEIARAAKIIELLAGRTGMDRLARFYTTMAVVDANGNRVWTGTGRCTLAVAEKLRGNHGFGYAFCMQFAEVAEGRLELLHDGQTLAQLGLAIKCRNSHRGDVTRQLAQWLKSLRLRVVA